MRKFYLAIAALTLVYSGVFAQAPIISVSPVSFDEAIVVGESATVTVTISNTGNRDLNWNVSLLSEAEIFFEKENYADWTLPENQDRITDNVWITRANNEGLFNIAQQEEFGGWNAGSPWGTQWAAGNSRNPETEYQDFMDLCSYLTSISPFSNYSCYMPLFKHEWYHENFGSVSLKIEDSHEYFDVFFEKWTSGAGVGGGGFAYTRFESFLWIEPTQMTGSVKPDESFPLEISLNQNAFLQGGTYHGHLVLESDDPNTQQILIEFHLEVLGTPDIALSPEEIDYGAKPFGGNYEEVLLIENTGDGVLEISNFQFDNPVFYHDPNMANENLIIAPGKTYELYLLFSPQSIDVFTGILSFTTNIPFEEEFVEVQVNLLGEGTEEPTYTASPVNFEFDLDADTFESKDLTIENTGNVLLEYTISFAYSQDNPLPNHFATVNISSGNVVVGESQVISLTSDATNLIAGNYEVDLQLHVNRPSEPLQTIPVTLLVSGLPDISVQGELNFEQAYIDYPKTLDLPITNNGSDLLNITSVMFDNVHFEVINYPASIPANATLNAEVSFTPLAEEAYSSNLTINSDDPLNPVVEVITIGSGIPAPVIVTDTSPITLEITAGTTEEVILTLENTGGSNLYGRFHAALSEPVFFEKQSYSDFSLEENQDRITESVWITRGNARGLINYKNEEFFDWVEDWIFPTGTVWAGVGSLEAAAIDYGTWTDAHNYNPPGQVGNTFSMITEEENRMFDILMQYWVSGGDGDWEPPFMGGGFAYYRIEAPFWVKMNTPEFEILPNETAGKTFVIDATDLIEGVYEGFIRIHSNDPTQEAIVIPLAVTVTGQPEITVVSDLDFGITSVGLISSKSITVENTGSSDLQLSSISIEGAGYSLESTPQLITIAPLQNYIFKLHFEPDAPGAYSGTLSFNTNDPDNESITINLTGEGIAPPEIEYSHDNLELWLAPNTTETVALTIGNLGDGALIWHIAGESVSFTKEDLADWELEENQDRISDNVWITRKDTQAWFNIAQEEGFSTPSPKGTLWSFGNTESLNHDDYEYWRDAVNNNPQSMVNNVLSMFIPDDHRFFDVLLRSYSGGGPGGGFSYTRTEILPNWIGIAPQSGVIEQGAAETEVEITINTTGLDGFYNFNMAIHTNDPANTQIPLSFNITVANIVLENPIDNQRMNEGFEEFTLDISEVFSSILPDPFSYIIVSENKDVVTATMHEVTPDLLVISEVSVGNSAISIRAEDSAGNFKYTDFEFTVNGAPYLENPMDDLEIEGGFVSTQLDLSNYFADPNNDPLTFFANSSNEDAVTVSTTGNILTINEVGVGTAAISVNANDGLADPASDSFNFKVNGAPFVENTIDDMEMDEGFENTTVDLSNVFSDPNGDPLSFEANSSNTDVVTLEISDDILTITEVGVGNADITITADNGFNTQIASENFNFKVNGAPFVENAIDDMEMKTGFESTTIDLSNVFSDPNGDPLTFTAESSNESVVTVAVSAETLIISEVGEGESQITVKASDGLLDVSDSFLFTVDPSVGVTTTSDNYLKLYPNPTSGYLTIQLDRQTNGGITIEVYNLIGQLMVQKTLTESESNINIDLSGLNSGIYQIRLRDQLSIIGTRAVVIQK